MREIALTRGKKALVDDADFEHLAQFNWCAVESGTQFYAARGTYDPVTGRKGLLFMHRYLFPTSIEVDHIDGMV